MSAESASIDYRMPRQKIALSCIATFAFAVVGFAMSRSATEVERALLLASSAFFLFVTVSGVHRVVRPPMVLQLHATGLTFHRPALLSPKPFFVPWDELLGVSEVVPGRNRLDWRRLHLLTAHHRHELLSVWFGPSLSEVRQSLLAARPPDTPPLVSLEQLEAQADEQRVASALLADSTEMVRARDLNRVGLRTWLVAAMLTVGPVLALGHVAVVVFGTFGGIVIALTFAAEKEFGDELLRALPAPEAATLRPAALSDVTLHVVLGVTTTVATWLLAALDLLGADGYGGIAVVTISLGGAGFFAVRRRQLRMFEREHGCTVYATEPWGRTRHRMLVRGPVEQQGPVIT